VGQKVGVGWHGGHCSFCEQCRRGDFILCKNELITGITHDGGYGISPLRVEIAFGHILMLVLAEYANIPVEALAAIPDGLSFAEAAPLLCAGITVFNSLRHR